MSTFKGIIAEFPQVRIDYFRHQPGSKAPLACFLSHVHSDHLTGLESLRAPFVYCSAATREMLLRLEKYHYRMNFAKGVLENRTVTYEAHMKKLAKPLPLETPTEIELAPGNRICVTLFDANHCVGAVMFLIQGNGNAVLYTGDIRAETWWVNSLVQNPILLPYSLGSRRLDCIYLDTTFATKSEPYREFPSKAAGIRELLAKVEECPKDTIFYFHSWTFGYENCWIALSSFLQSRIHLDEYRSRIYNSLSREKNQFLKDHGFEIREAPALCGFTNGNHKHQGCLTSQIDVRIHSCERGTGCPVIDGNTKTKVVHIIPIITRTVGTEIAELGAGGGKGDLDREKDEVDAQDVADVCKLMELCRSKIGDPQLLAKVLALLEEELGKGNGKIDLGEELDDDLSLQSMITSLSRRVTEDNDLQRKAKSIRFPYARHSSYSELCAFMEAFKPKDVFPCTVDEARWTPSLGMRNLFGQYCSADIFRHDDYMMNIYESRLDRERNMKRNHEETQSTEMDGESTPKRSKYKTNMESQTTEDDVQDAGFVTPGESCSSREQQARTQNMASGASPPKSASLPRQQTSNEMMIQKTTNTRPLVEKQPDVIVIHDSPDSEAEPIPPPLAAPAAPEVKEMKGMNVQTPSIARIPAQLPNASISSLPHPDISRLSAATSLPSSDAVSCLISTDRSKLSKEDRRDRRTRQRAREIAYKAAIGEELTWADMGGLTCVKRDQDDDVEL